MEKGLGVIVVGVLCFICGGCDSAGSRSDPKLLGVSASDLGVSAIDLGVYPPSQVTLKASVETATFWRFLPIGLEISVMNATSSPVTVPKLLLGTGVVKISMALPSGTIVHPAGQGGMSMGGELKKDLAPGESLSETVTLHLGPSGDYLFRETGLYVIQVTYLGLSVKVPLSVTSSTDAADLAAEKLLDDDEARRLVIFEGGYNLKKALARLVAIDALTPPSSVYQSYARYGLGLAHARAGADVCGGISTFPANVNAGESYLSSAIPDLPTTYLKKRAAYWLARCYKNKGDIANYQKYRSLFSSMSHGFPRNEESLIE
jgi:hypothetical protein